MATKKKTNRTWWYILANPYMKSIRVKAESMTEAKRKAYVRIQNMSYEEFKEHVPLEAGFKAWAQYYSVWKPKKASKINWQVFKDSSYCEKGLAEFAMGKIKTFKAFEKYFLPGRKDQAAEVRKMRGMGIKKARRAAARAFKRITRMSIKEAYGPQYKKYA